MYKIEVEDKLQRVLKRLHKRDRARYEQIIKKAEEIRKNPQRYKNLRAPMQHLKRVHIGNHILLFYVDERKKIVRLYDYTHHDEAYV